MDFITPLTIGLIGSFHCIGMCGPIAVALPLKNQTWATKVTGVVVYNSGRILTYAALGLIFGLLGRGIQLAGFQRWASILLGILMIVSVLFPYFFRQKIKIGSIFSGYAYRLTSNLKQLFKNRSYSSLVSIGLLNGLLPCGLVYVAIAGAINTNNITSGALFMVLFGLGTVPLLMVVTLVGNVIGIGLRNKMRKVVPYFVVLLGLLFIMRGMSLGIPYVSPKQEKLAPKEMVVKHENCCT